MVFAKPKRPILKKRGAGNFYSSITCFLSQVQLGIFIETPVLYTVGL